MAAAQPKESPAAARDTLIQSFVTVYERDGAARIAFRQPVSTSGAFYWWTGDDTAVAERDYIALEQPPVAFAAPFQRRPGQSGHRALEGFAEPSVLTQVLYG